MGTRALTLALALAFALPAGAQGPDALEPALEAVALKAFEAQTSPALLPEAAEEWKRLKEDRRHRSALAAPAYAEKVAAIEALLSVVTPERYAALLGDRGFAAFAEGRGLRRDAARGAFVAGTKLATLAELRAAADAYDAHAARSGQDWNPPPGEPESIDPQRAEAAMNEGARAFERLKATDPEAAQRLFDRLLNFSNAQSRRDDLPGNPQLQSAVSRIVQRQENLKTTARTRAPSAPAAPAAPVGTTAELIDRLETGARPWGPGAAARPAAGPAKAFVDRIAAFRAELSARLPAGLENFAADLSAARAAYEALDEPQRRRTANIWWEAQLLASAAEAVKAGRDADVTQRLLSGISRRLDLPPAQAAAAEARALTRASRANPSDVRLRDRASLADFEKRLEDLRAGIARAARTEPAGLHGDWDALFDGLASRAEGLESREPDRLYSLIDRVERLRRELPARSRDVLLHGSSFARYDQALAGLAASARGRGAPAGALDEARRSARIAFYAALVELPATSRAARAAAAGVARDSAFRELDARGAALLARLPQGRREHFAAMREAARGSSDRDGALSRFAFELQTELEAGDLGEGKRLAAGLEEAAADMAGLDAAAFLGPDSPVTAGMRERLEAMKAAGREPSERELQTLLDEILRAHADDPGVIEMMEALDDLRLEQGELARRAADFAEANPDYAAFLAARARHAGALLGDYAAGNVRPGIGGDVVFPDGRRAVIRAGSAFDARGRTIRLRDTGFSEDAPELVRRLWSPPAVDGPREREVPGYTLVFGEGREEFRSSDGRLVIRTLREEGRVVQSYEVDGRPAGRTEYFPGKDLHHVASVKPGSPNIQGLRTEGRENGRVVKYDRRGMVRLDGLAAMPDASARRAAWRERAREMAAYLEEAGDARVPDPALLETFMLHLAEAARRAGSRLEVSLDESAGGGDGHVRVVETRSDGVVRVTEASINQEDGRIEAGVVDHNPDGSRRPTALQLVYRRAGDKIELAKTMTMYVEDTQGRHQWLHGTGYGDQSVTSLHDLSPDGRESSGRDGGRGAVVVRMRVESAFMNAAGALGSGVTGFGTTIWTGAVGTGKLVVGGVGGLVDEEFGAKYTADGLAQFAANPLSQGVWAGGFWNPGSGRSPSRFADFAFSSLSEAEQRAVARADINWGGEREADYGAYGDDGRRAFARASDSAGNLYRWGGQARDPVSRGAFYALGGLMDFGRGTAESLPYLGAGRGVSALLGSGARGIAAGRAVDQAIGLYFMAAGAREIAHLPAQIKAFDPSKEETVRPIMGQMSNLLMMWAGERMARGKLSPKPSKPFGIDLGGTAAAAERAAVRPRAPPELAEAVKTVALEHFMDSLLGLERYKEQTASVQHLRGNRLQVEFADIDRGAGAWYVERPGHPPKIQISRRHAAAPLTELVSILAHEMQHHVDARAERGASARTVAEHEVRAHAAQAVVERVVRDYVRSLDPAAVRRAAAHADAVALHELLRSHDTLLERAGRGEILDHVRRRYPELAESRDVARTLRVRSRRAEALERTIANDGIASLSELDRAALRELAGEIPAGADPVAALRGARERMRMEADLLTLQGRAELAPPGVAATGRDAGGVRVMRADSGLTPPRPPQGAPGARAPPAVALHSLFDAETARRLRAQDPALFEDTVLSEVVRTASGTEARVKIEKTPGEGTFQHEARRVLDSGGARFEGVSIPRVLGTETLPGGPHAFVMEHIDGIPLSQHLERGGRVSTRNWRSLRDLIQALHKEGLAHGDMKDHNILVDAQGRLHLIDFEMAKAPTRDIHRGGRWEAVAPAVADRHEFTGITDAIRARGAFFDPPAAPAPPGRTMPSRASDPIAAVPAALLTAPTGPLGRGVREMSRDVLTAAFRDDPAPARLLRGDGPVAVKVNGKPGEAARQREASSVPAPANVIVPRVAAEGPMPQSPALRIIVMEKAGGTGLDRYLAPGPGARLPRPIRRDDWTAFEAHMRSMNDRGIAHGDLSNPENVRISMDAAGRTTFWLIDFGEGGIGDPVPLAKDRTDLVALSARLARAGLLEAAAR